MIVVVSVGAESAQAEEECWSAHRFDTCTLAHVLSLSKSCCVHSITLATHSRWLKVATKWSCIVCLCLCRHTNHKRHTLEYEHTHTQLRQRFPSYDLSCTVAACGVDKAVSLCLCVCARCVCLQGMCVCVLNVSVCMCVCEHVCVFV